MKRVSHGPGIIAALLCAAVLAAAAQDNRTGALEGQRASIQEAKALFRQRRKQERQAFRHKQVEARRTFAAALKDKTPAERQNLRREFRAKQKAERAAFNREQKERRQAFLKGGHDRKS